MESEKSVYEYNNLYTYTSPYIIATLLSAQHRLAAVPDWDSLPRASVV